MQADILIEVGLIKDKLRAYIELVDDTDKNGGVTRSYRVRLESKSDFYSLLHECIHLTRHIFEDRGIPFNGKNDEAIAYYTTYLFKRIWRKVNTKRG